MAEGILVVDERGRIIMINEAIQKLFSLSTEVVDKTPLEVIHNSELEGTIQEAIRDEKNSSFELPLPSPLGKIFEVNVVGIHPSSEGNHEMGRGMRGAAAVFHDICRFKELERIRQDFVANVSHELRTPLTTIKGYAETLLEGSYSGKKSLVLSLERKSIPPMVSIYLLKFNVLLRFERMRRGLPYPVVDFS